MLSNNIVFLIIETIGICAFAISGIIVAIDKKLDILGVAVLGVVNALGGGLIRDIILDVNPPALFSDEKSLIFMLIVIIISVILFIFARYKKSFKYIIQFNNNLFFNIADTIGLAVFCILGANAALNTGNQNDPFLIIVVGCITGVGGGIMRDILTGNIPIVFKKKVYVLPAILGTALYVYLTPLISANIAMLTGVVFIIVFRIFAIIFKWNLPSIK